MGNTLSLADCQKLGINSLFMGVIVNKHSFKESTSILIKNGNSFFNLNDNTFVDLSTHRLENLEPFAKYYSASDYKFTTDQDNRILINLNYSEPYTEYKKAVNS